MPVSPGYKYLLVMTDTFTEQTEGFPTWTEKQRIKAVIKRKKENDSKKSFQDLACPGHYKMTMGHHLLLRSPKGSLKHWALLITSIAPGGLILQEKQKSESESCSIVSDSATPWAILSMEFSRPKYWSGQPFPSPGNLPNPGIKPKSPVLQADSLLTESAGKPQKYSNNLF